MTKEKRNLEIGKMIGMIFEHGYVINWKDYLYLMSNFEESPRFHSDWKWLMEAVDFIEKLDLTDEHYSWEDDEGKTRNNFKCLSVDIERNRCYIDEELELDPPHCVVQYVGENKLDATFMCVSDFAKIFNERKNEKTKN